MPVDSESGTCPNCKRQFMMAGDVTYAVCPKCGTPLRWVKSESASAETGGSGGLSLVALIVLIIAIIYILGEASGAGP